MIQSDLENEIKEGSLNHYTNRFEECHKREFGFNFEKRRIIIDNLRVRSIG
jgi:N-methylhydantoinase A/oxoprolinase/acetone carboxylase beta subunit